MRLAVLGDIHGNLAALEAVLEHAHGLDSDGLNPDGFVVVGDIVVGAPDSLACWERVEALKCPVLRGNHETYNGGVRHGGVPGLVDAAVRAGRLGGEAVR